MSPTMQASFHSEPKPTEAGDSAWHSRSASLMTSTDGRRPSWTRFWRRTGELEAILKHLGDDDLRDFVEWCYWCGMRPGEIKSLTWEAFDRETSTLRLHASAAKTGYGRVLALEGPLRAIIERRLKAHRLDCAAIFHRYGRPIGEFRKTWTRACRAAGLEGKLFYDLRRTAVRNMVRAGVPERVAMTISGHRTRAVFDRYNIVSEDDLRAAVQKTSAYVDGLPSTPTVVPFPGMKRTAE